MHDDTDDPLTAYTDCVQPEDCACKARGYPQYDHTRCLVPGINALAIRLGWEPPYDYFPLRND
jgi:hypothetical protein